MKGMASGNRYPVNKPQLRHDSQNTTQDVANICEFFVLLNLDNPRDSTTSVPTSQSFGMSRTKPFGKADLVTWLYFVTLSLCLDGAPCMSVFFKQLNSFHVLCT